jgi:hypothetical protein
MINLTFFVPAAIIILLLSAYVFNKVRTFALLFFIFFSSTGLFAQKTDTTKKPIPKDTVKKVTPIDTIKPGNGPVKEQLKEIKAARKTITDTTGNQPKKKPFIDTTIYNKYGDLLNDDPKFNRKSSIWRPALEVFGVNTALNLWDRYIANLPFARTDIHSWIRNLNAGWPWGNGWIWNYDRFGVNFLLHPVTGSAYFNAARSNGYNFWQSTPYVLAGSYMWKIFGENGKPEREDLLNTTFDGVLVGEILYRLSSNILDDRATGGNRVFREIAAGLVDPVRGLNRLLQGKTFRHTTTEVYQKEPLNITLFGGVHKINTDDNTIFGKGPTDALFNMQLDYGNPFEDIHRKPFDLFRFRTEFSFGSGRKILDNITGYGVLFGNNVDAGKFSMLYGAFQYYDYWDNITFELATIGFGGGVITKYPFTKDIILYTSFHVAGVPLAGNSTRFGPNTSQVGDYAFDDGLEAQFAARLNFGKYVSTAVEYYYYILHTFNGQPGNNYVAILKPRLTIYLFKNTSIGFEQFIYYDDRYLKNVSPIFSVRTEQKIFLSLFLEDPQRKGRYN